MNLVIQLIANLIAVLVADYLLTGIHISDYTTAAIVVIVMGVINMFVKPVLSLLTLPLTILTLGLFAFVLNALLVLLVSFLVPNFTVDNILWALGFSIIVSLVNAFLNTFIK